MRGNRQKAREDDYGSDDECDVDDDDYNGDATVTALGHWLWFDVGARLQFSILMTKVVSLDDKSRELNKVAERELNKVAETKVVEMRQK